MGWLKKWRTSRGFGVHSPFAFEFIREVLRQPCPYYAYDAIDDSRTRLLYRVAVRFRRLAVEGPLSAAERRAINLAGATIGDPTPDVTIVTDPQKIAPLRAAMTEGMSFSNGRRAILVHSSGLPLTHFDLYF